MEKIVAGGWGKSYWFHPEICVSPYLPLPCRWDLRKYEEICETYEGILCGKYEEIIMKKIWKNNYDGTCKKYEGIEGVCGT